ncbi:MAG: ferritin family protein [Thermodesulfobacteriota bacterium]|nr:ferritin family protein [Thermodesulfobacteriota bacterium]
MSYDFNADEIFEIAEEIERNGAKFYRQMSENFSETPVRELFLDLAAMEDDHEKAFVSMRADLSGQEHKTTIFDPEGESALYLRALADLRVFDKDAQEDFVLPTGLSEQEQMQRVLHTAIGLEKDSIVFYLGMKELVPENLGKDKIDGIIKEEMGHIKLLSNRLSLLKKVL